MSEFDDITNAELDALDNPPVMDATKVEERIESGDSFSSIVEDGDTIDLIDVHGDKFANELSMIELASQEKGTLKVENKSGKLVARVEGVIWEGLATEFCEALTKSPNAKELEVVINSVGGSVRAGRQIYDEIRAHSARQKTTVVRGMAASMAGIVALAGDKRVITAGSQIMVHEVQPTAEQLESWLETRNKFNDALKRVIRVRTGAENDVVDEMFDGTDTYLDAEEAKEYGFATHVIDDNGEENKVDASNSQSVWTVEAEQELLEFVAMADGLGEAKKPKAPVSGSGKKTKAPEPTGDNTVFEKWLKAQGIDPKTLNASQLASWKNIYNGETGEPSSIDDTIKAKGGDGAALENDDDAFLARRKRRKNIEAKLGEWDDLVESAVKEDWSNERIENEALKKENESLRNKADEGIGRDWAPITSKGKNSEKQLLEVAECSLALAVGTKTEDLQNLYRKEDGTTLDRVEKAKLGYTEMENFSDEVIEASLKLNRECGGEVGFRQIGNIALGRSPHAGMIFEDEMMNIFSDSKMLSWVRKACDRRLIPNFRESPFVYNRFVNTVNGTYREEKRYRSYMIGPLAEVPKGGEVDKGKLDSADAYSTNLSRFARKYVIDECWFEDGDFGSLREMITKASAAGRRSPEEKFFDLLRKYFQGQKKINFNDDLEGFLDAAWKVWCNCTVMDPADSNNKDCGPGVYVDGARMTILASKFDAIEWERLFRGAPHLCGDDPEKCETRYLINLFGKYMDIELSPRIPSGHMVILPQASEDVTAFTMTVKNGVLIPRTRVFPMSCDNFGIPIRVEHHYNIQTAEKRFIKTAGEVFKFMESMQSAA